MSMKKMLVVVAAAALAAAAAPALAANPFTDVPLGHWAYDAVEELSAKGILAGYPNGTFRGGRAMTRYEIATMVARMMQSDLNGADAEKLKALVTEFQPELESLGVKVDGFDSRLTSLEKGLSGWKISGEMVFDFNGFGKNFEDAGHGFEFDTARLFLHRDMNNGVSFDAEFGDDNTFDRYWVTAEDFLGWEGFTFKAGQFDIDYEGEDGLYFDEHEDAGFFQGLPYRGVEVNKSFGLAEFDAFVASNVGDDGVSIYNANESGEYYGARLKFNFNEKIWLSANYYVSKPGDEAEVGVGEFKTIWAAAGFKFGGDIELKGAYYWQDVDADSRYANIDDPKAYKVILSVGQDALKFTSLWAEYAHFDKGFVLENTPYAFHSHTADALGDSELICPVKDDTDVMFFALKQEWTEKWSTFERYHQYDMDNYGKLKDFAIGVGYQYTPNLAFELSYNRVKGDDTFTSLEGKGDIVRFRTLLSF